jgi:TOBE domain-containing protein
VSVGIRAERLGLERPSGALAADALAGTLDDEIYLGDATEWHVLLGDLRLVVTEPAVKARQRRRGEAVVVACDPLAVLRLDAGA